MQSVIVLGKYWPHGATSTQTCLYDTLLITQFCTTNLQWPN